MCETSNHGIPSDVNPYPRGRGRTWVSVGPSAEHDRIVSGRGVQETDGLSDIHGEKFRTAWIDEFAEVWAKHPELPVLGLP